MSWRRFNEWGTGSRTELCWSLMHEIQLMLLGIATLPLMQDLLEVVVKHSQILPTNDTARFRLIDFTQK